MMEPKSKMQISLILLVLILHLHMLPFSYCKSIVKHLPGYSGELPFTLETGYVGVGKHEEVQLFYYFVESQRNPDKDPLLLYLTGGPGTSAILPFFYQIGPLNFEYTNASRSDVKLEVNPYSWTKTANVIFIDQPVGTGFSYTKTLESSTRNSDTLAVNHTYDFIRKWLIEHPTFLNNPFYVSGISYMGLFIPRIVSKIYEGDEHGVTPKLNFKGYLIVNPFTDRFIDLNSRIEFVYRAGLIEEEIYEMHCHDGSLAIILQQLSLKPAKKNCKGKYVSVDPNNTLCLNSLRPINDCISGLNINHILEPVCNPQEPKLICRESIYPFFNTWANKNSVREALHIRKGTVSTFQFSNTTISASTGRPDTIYYSHDIVSSLSYYKQLATKKCQALIINGDHDMTFPYVGTKQWINSLKFRVTSPWKPWFVRTQVAGYEKTFSKAKYTLKYTTVKGAGHSVAIYKPEELMVLVDAWFTSHTNSSNP